MNTINENTIVIAPALCKDSTYFIFRSAREQIEIKVMPNAVIATDILNADEMAYISVHYPWIDILKYEVIKKIY